MALPLLPRQIYPGRQLTSLSKCRWRGASECHSIIHNATSRIRGSLSDRSVHADMEMFTGSTSCHASHPRRTVRLQDSSNGVEGFFFPIFLLFFFFFLLTIPEITIQTRSKRGEKAEEIRNFREKNGNRGGRGFIFHSTRALDRVKGAFVFLLISARREITRLHRP